MKIKRKYKRAFIKNKVALAIGILVVTNIGSFIGGATVFYDESKVAPQEIQTFKTNRDSLNRDNILVLINEERIKAGKAQLGINNNLNDIAQKRSAVLTSDCLHDFDITSQGYSEILVCNVNTSLQAIAQWKSSLTHNDLMLSGQYSGIGIGITGKNVAVILSR